MAEQTKDYHVVLPFKDSGVFVVVGFFVCFVLLSFAISTSVIWKHGGKWMKIGGTYR